MKMVTNKYVITYNADTKRYDSVSYDMEPQALFLSCKAQWNPVAYSDFDIHIVLYFLVDETAEASVKHTFHVIGTHEEVPPNLVFCDTIRIKEGEHMWHVWDEIG